jgi:ClpP class serine protease
VNGVPELADVVAGVEKPIFAFTAGMMDSAAYWTAAACDQIFATRSADIGSIGVYVPFLDESAAYEMEGLSVELFASGKYKGMGFPGTKLTSTQREQIQKEIVSIADMFKSHVLENRPDMDEDTMQGQSFMGVDALKLGLVDGIVEDKSDVTGMM